MLGRLQLGRPPFRPSWVPVHAGCTTNGQVVTVLGPEREGLIQLARCSMDQACLEELEGGARGEGYNLTLISAEAPLKVTIAGKSIQLKPPRYVVVNPREQSWMEGGKGFTGLFLSVNQFVLRDVREAVGIPSVLGPFDFDRNPAVPTPRLREVLARLGRFVGQAADEERDRWLPALVYGAVVELLEEIWHSHPSDLRKRLAAKGYRPTGDPRLDRALEYMRDHFAEECPNERVAKAAGLSPQHFYRLFQRALACSPHEYLRRLRVYQAERLLSRSPKRKSTLAEVASAVGLGRAQSLREAYEAVRGRPLQE